MRLEPGAYTAIVTSASPASPRGIGIVEVVKAPEGPVEPPARPALESFGVSHTRVNATSGPVLVEITANVSGLVGDNAYVTVWVEDRGRMGEDDHFVALATERGPGGQVTLQVPAGLDEASERDYEGDIVGPPSLQIGGITFGVNDINFLSAADLEALGYPTRIQIDSNAPLTTTVEGQFYDPDAYSDNLTNPQYQFTVDTDGIVAIRHQWVDDHTYRNVWLDITDLDGNSMLDSSAIEFRPRIGAFLTAGTYILDLRACCSFDGEYTLSFAGPVSGVVRDTDRDGITDPHDPDRDNDGISNEIEAQYAAAGILNPLSWMDASLDQDRDGASNLAEILAGTNPGDRDDSPALLTEIDFADDNLRDCVLGAGYRHVSAVTELDCSWREISDISGLEQLVGLESFRFRGNNATDFTALASLPRLTELNVGDVNLANLDFISGLTGLEILDLSHSGLTDVDGLGAFSQLRELILFDNNLRSLPSLDHMPLERLDVQQNELAALPALPATIVELRAGGNPLTSLGDLSTLSLLELLDASDAQLSSLPAFDPIAPLATLNVRGNLISDLSAAGALTGLETLDAGDNALTTLPAMDGTVLLELIVDNNQLAQLPALPNTLVRIQASGNELTDIGAIQTVPELQTLDVSNNHLGNSAIGQLAGVDLRLLNIANNAITQFNGLGDPATFIASDEGRPQLIAVQVSPTEVDLDAGGVLALRVDAEATLRGIVTLSGPSGQISNFPFVSGQDAAGRFSPFEESGPWRVEQIEAFTDDGDLALYNRMALSQADGFVGELTLTGSNSDIAPPTIAALNMSATTVDVSEGPQLVTFEVLMSDDVSGLAQFNIHVVDASGRRIFGRYSGQPALRFEIPVDGSRGDIRIQDIQTCDNAGNCDVIETFELEELGWPAVVEVTGEATGTTLTAGFNRASRVNGLYLGSPAWTFDVTETGVVSFNFATGWGMNLRIEDASGFAVFEANGTSIGGELNPGTYQLVTEACCDREEELDLTMSGPVANVTLDSDADGIADTADSDMDGDGITNTRELELGFDPQLWIDGYADADGDDAPNWLELAEGSDHQDSNSRPRRTSDVSFSDGRLASCVSSRNEQFAGLIRELRCDSRGVGSLGGIEALTNLRVLQLGWNELTNIGHIATLVNLEELDVRSNDIVSLSPLADLAKLEELRVGDNRNADPGSLPNLPRLTFLEFNSADITTVDAFAQLTQLRHLDLNWNRIVDIAPLASLSSLRDLRINGNAIRSLDPVAGLEDLETLHARDNPLTSASAIQGLDLLELELGVALLTEITDIAGQERLQYLWIKGDWDQIDRSAVADITPVLGLNQLTHLQIQGTALSDLTPLADMSSLINLFVENNRIADLSPLAALPALRQLSVNDNPLTDIEALVELPQLDHLWIANTGLTDASIVMRLPGLTMLDLRDNSLNQLPDLGALPLTWLDVSDNELTNINGLSGLGTLQELRARNNGITDINVLATLLQLTSLRLDGNAVTNYSPLDAVGLRGPDNSDEGRPVLLSLEVPTTVDTDRPGGLLVRAEFATDGDHTVDHFNFHLNSPSGGNREGFHTDGHSMAVIRNFEAGLETGLWRGDMWMCTSQGPCYSYSSATLKALGFEPDVPFTSTLPEPTPPALTAIGLPTEVDSASASVIIEGAVDASGYTTGRLELAHTSTDRRRYIEFDPEAPFGPLRFNPDDPHGSWTVSLTLNIGPREYHWSAGDLIAMGQPALLDLAASSTAGNQRLLSELSFPDQALQSCVRNHWRTVDDLTSLRCNGSGIASLEGIEQLTSLAYLDIGNNPVSDLTPLADSHTLRRIQLRNSEVTNLAPLAGLPWLHEVLIEGLAAALPTLPQGLPLHALDLSHTDLDSLDLLAGYPQLTDLTIDNTNVTSLDGLSQVPNLTRLGIQDLAISNLDALAQLIHLEELDADDIPVENITAIANLQLTHLTLNGALLPDLSALAAITTLRSLNIDGSFGPVHTSPISDVAPLAALANLEELTLTDTLISDLSELGGLPRLRTLHLGNNQLTDLSSLTGLQLQELSVIDNEISSIAPLTGMPLTWLDISRTRVTDIAPLATLSNLNEIYAYDNRITRLEPIEGLPLGRINFDRNPIADFTPLAGLSSLWAVDLDGTGLTNLDVFANKTRLGHLTIRGNAVTDYSPLDTLSLWHRGTDEGMPAVTAVTFPDTIDLSAGAANITAEVEIDATNSDYSVSSASVELFDETGQHHLSFTWDQQHGPQLGEAVSRLLRTSVTSGTWFLQVRVCVDGGPCWSLGSNTLATLGLPSTVEVIAPEAGDRTPPELTNLTLSTTAVDLDGGSQAVHVDFNADGYTWARINVRRIDWQHGQSIYPLPQEPEGYFTFGANTQPGIYVLTVSMNDPAGNHIDLNYGNLVAAGHPGLIRVTGTGAPGDPVALDSLTFADAQLANCVQQAATYVHELTNLRCNWDSIASLEGIQQLTAVVHASLRGNQITDASPLAGLPSLVTLDISRNALDSFASLENLDSLQTLTAGENDAPVSTLPVLPDVYALNLDNQAVTHLSELADWSHLRELRIHNAGLTNLTGAAAFSQLRRLFADGNRVRNLAPLEDVPLRILDLGNNPVMSLDGLSGLPLERLILGIGFVTTLEGIETLTDLNHLHLYGQFHHLSRSPLTDSDRRRDHRGQSGERGGNPRAWAFAAGFSRSG